MDSAQFIKRVDEGAIVIDDIAQAILWIGDHDDLIVNHPIIKMIQAHSRRRTGGDLVWDRSSGSFGFWTMKHDDTFRIMDLANKNVFPFIKDKVNLLWSDMVMARVWILYNVQCLNTYQQKLMSVWLSRSDYMTENRWFLIANDPHKVQYLKDYCMVIRAPRGLPLMPRHQKIVEAYVKAIEACVAKEDLNTARELWNKWIKTGLDVSLLLNEWFKYLSSPDNGLGISDESLHKLAAIWARGTRRTDPYPQWNLDYIFLERVGVTLSPP